MQNVEVVLFQLVPFSKDVFVYKVIKQNGKLAEKTSAIFT